VETADSGKSVESEVLVPTMVEENGGMKSNNMEDQVPEKGEEAKIGEHPLTGGLENAETVETADSGKSVESEALVPMEDQVPAKGEEAKIGENVETVETADGGKSVESAALVDEFLRDFEFIYLDELDDVEFIPHFLESSVELV
jgi:hypothetical protein